jgi:4a-hydroxytetrahydrobiopterin dehydratase
MESNDLASEECVPCTGGVPAIKGAKLREMHEKLGFAWRVVDEHHLERTFTFPNFRLAMAFTNRVGELAEEVNHHPDIELGWGRVKVLVWTHKINGLTESDFIFAAKVDQLQPA